MNISPHELSLASADKPTHPACPARSTRDQPVGDVPALSDARPHLAFFACSSRFSSSANFRRSPIAAVTRNARITALSVTIAATGGKTLFDSSPADPTNCVSARTWSRVERGADEPSSMVGTVVNALASRCAPYGKTAMHSTNESTLRAIGLRARNKEKRQQRPRGVQDEATHQRLSLTPACSTRRSSLEGPGCRPVARRDDMQREGMTVTGGATSFLVYLWESSATPQLHRGAPTNVH